MCTMEVRRVIALCEVSLIWELAWYVNGTITRHQALILSIRGTAGLIHSLETRRYETKVVSPP